MTEKDLNKGDTLRDPDGQFWEVETIFSDKDILLARSDYKVYSPEELKDWKRC